MASDDQVINSISSSMEDMNKSMGRLMAKSEQLANTLDKNLKKIGTGAKKAGTDVAAGMQASTRAAQGLSFQLNDISTSLQGGASPFTVMMQQGSQVAQVFTDLKAQGGSAGSALVGAMKSMIGPTQLVTFGLIALAGFAAQWAGQMISGTKEVDTETLKLLSSVDKLAEAYSGDLGPKGTKALNDISLAAKRALDAQEMKKTADTLASTLEGSFDPLTNRFAKMRAAMLAMVPKPEITAIKDFADSFLAIEKAANEGGDALGMIKKHITELDTIITKYQGSALAKMATEQKEALQALVPQITETIEATQGLTAAQRALATGVTPLISAQKAIGEVMDEIRKKVRDNRSEYEKLLDVTGKMTTATAGLEDRQQYVFDRRANVAAQEAIGSDQTLFLQSRAMNEKIRQRVTQLDAAMAERLAPLLQEFPELRIESAVRTFAEQYKIKYIDKITPAAEPGKSRHEIGEAVDLNLGGMTPERYDELTAAAKRYGLVFPLPGNDPGHLQLLKDEKVELSEAARAAKSAEEAYSNLTAAKRESLSLSEFENSVNADATLKAGEKIALIEREKTLRELNAAAQVTGNELTQQEIAANTELADAAGKNAQAKYDIAEANREAAKSSKELTTEQQQLASTLNTLEASIGSGLSQFVIDLKNGQSAGEAFKSMINSLIEDLIRMTIQLYIMKPLMDAIRGSAGLPTSGAGAGAAMSGGTVGATGFPKASVSPLAFANAPSFAGGGMVGLASGAVPIIAHKGEIIVPTSVLRKAAGQTRGGKGDTINIDGRSSVRVDIANGNGTSVTQASSIQFGQVIDRTIQAVLVRESKPGGLLRQQPGAR